MPWLKKMIFKFQFNVGTVDLWDFLVAFSVVVFCLAAYVRQAAGLVDHKTGFNYLRRPRFYQFSLQQK